MSPADLGVRYAVEGSLRRSGDDMRINVQLVDATTGANLWAERYERSTADVFSIEEEIVGHIATALGVALTPTEQARLARPPTRNLEAYDFFLRAERIARGGYRPTSARPLIFIERATELDPTFAERVRCAGGAGGLCLALQLRYRSAGTGGAQGGLREGEPRTRAES